MLCLVIFLTGCGKKASDKKEGEDMVKEPENQQEVITDENGKNDETANENQTPIPYPHPMKRQHPITNRMNRQPGRAGS